MNFHKYNKSFFISPFSVKLLYVVTTSNFIVINIIFIAVSWKLNEDIVIFSETNILKRNNNTTRNLKDEF